MKILIVEDEILTRESLARELQALGYPHIAMASDGIEALASVAANRPDVIFSDVRMPRMDGLRLQQELKKNGASPLFVIVSGYDSFEYAKTALEQGAFSYLLKPVEENDLKSCVSRLENRLVHDRRRASQMTEADRKARKYFQLAQKQMLQQMIQEEITDENELSAHFKAMDIALPYERFTILTMGIDQFEQLASACTNADLQLYKFGIENIAQEHLEDLGVAVLPFESGQDLGFLVNLPANPLLEQQLALALDKIVESTRVYLKFTITIGVGDTFGTLSGLHKSYTQAKKAAMSRMTQGGNRVYVYKALKPEPAAAPVVMNFETEQRLQLCMERCEPEAAKMILRRLYEQASEQSASLMKLNFHVAGTLTKLLNRLGLNPEAFLGSELKLYRKLNLCTSLEQLMLTLDEVVDICYAQIGLNEKIWNNSVMAKAMEYILHHYREDISLQSVSEHINLSPTYLSKQFKKTYNQNFIEFLIQYRIEKARELLKSSAYTANEIASIVGFKDEKHFFRTFKKITGVTPGAYKRGEL